MSAPEKRLYLLEAGRQRIVSVAADGSDRRTLIPWAGGTPDGIQVVPEMDRIYWTTMGYLDHHGPGGIWCARLDGSTMRRLVGGRQVDTPKQLVADPQGGFLYWCDREGMRVMRARLDGREVTPLIRRRPVGGPADKERECVGIAIDRAAGFLYWTQKGPPDGDRGRIFRCPLSPIAPDHPEARHDVECLLSGLPEPIDLEIDPSDNLLYWTDRGNRTGGNSLNVARITHQGLCGHRVIAAGFSEAIGLALDGQGHAFVGDLGGRLYRVGLPSGHVESWGKFGILTGLAYA